ncbi:MAG: Nif3-like dinuclear metal center hexameric protein, partial [Bacteroidota bacterium]
GGSGSFLLEEAIAAEADAFVTGDVTHHKFFDAQDQILYCDIGHWESEQFTADLIYNYLLANSEKFANFALYKSEVNTNPVRYFT